LLGVSIGVSWFRRYAFHRFFEVAVAKMGIPPRTATAFVIFTADLELRALDWPDWCRLTHAKKRNLVATRAVIAARIRAARQ